ncbi:MAG: hypothetical protein HY225_04350 [Candidatus Vogelbacteria bacterium]|nr:hypothetical protein [Candidatus Vogelbacteria bacterium]
MAKTGLVFEVASSNYEEDMTLALPVAELVKLLSLGKAQSLMSLTYSICANNFGYVFESVFF